MYLVPEPGAVDVLLKIEFLLQGPKIAYKSITL
jgi:hypothetical protein